MKRISKTLFGLMFGLLALFSPCFFLNKTPTKASALTPVSVEFRLNGGTVNGSGNNFYLETNTDGLLLDSSGNLLTSLPEATRENYIFKGWFKVDAQSPVDINTIYETATTLEARWTAKTHTYVISNDSATTYCVVGETATEGLTYDVLTNSSSIQAVITAIENDLASSSSAKIIFDDIEIVSDESISLTCKNIEVSGKITSTKTRPVFEINPQENDSTYKFTGFSVTSASNVIVAPQTSTFSSTIIVESSTFESSAQNSYAIFFKSNNYTFELSEIEVDENAEPLINSHTSTYMFNYIAGLNLNFSNQLNNLSSAPLIGTISYEFDKVYITDNMNIGNFGKIKFLSTSPAYTISEFCMESDLQITANLNFSFDRNGGYYRQDYAVPTFNYSNTNKINFPIGGEILKNFNTFETWVGKFELSQEQAETLGLNSTTYFYNNECLTDLKNAGYDLTKLDEFFKTSLDDIASNSGFSTYQFVDGSEFLPFEFGIKTSTTPTFVAKWSLTNYTITFNSNGGSNVDSISVPFETQITSPTPTKAGYSFGGWFKDSDLTEEFTFNTMPALNFTLYAKWNINSYTITFMNGETKVGETTQLFETEIIFPENVTKTGHYFDTWCLDADLTTEFTQTTIPASNTTLYAKWEKKTIYIYLVANPAKDENLNLSLYPLVGKYGDKITAPNTPTVEGYTFVNWFTSTSWQTPFSFTTFPAESTSAFARWIVNSYTITYKTGTSPATIEKTYYYGEKITIPSQPTKAGYSFEGWFADEQLTNAYTFDTMPASNLTLHAKWTAKQVISLSIEPQQVEFESNESFNHGSNFNNIVVEYLVNDSWTTNIPTEIGKYDVRLYRAEDDNYAEFISVIEDGFVIVNKTLDISWLIVLLAALFLLEVVAIVFIKKAQKDKRIQVVPFALTLPVGIVTTNQLILAIIVSSIVLLTFIYLIYEIVKLHRIVPENKKEPSVYDVRHQIEQADGKTEDSAISKKVNDMLIKEGFSSRNQNNDRK